MTKERKPEKREIGLDPRDRSVFAAAAGSGVLPEPRGFPQAILTPPLSNEQQPRRVLISIPNREAAAVAPGPIKGNVNRRAAIGSGSRA
jgi:hypothetical protein